MALTMVNIWGDKGITCMIGNDTKNPAILCFFFVTEKTQLNAVHAQLLEKLRLIA